MEAQDPVEFAALGKVKLRAYQEEVARAVIDSVLNRRGLTFVVMFPRQSGKNELQAQIEAYLLFHLQEQDAEIVKVSPTLRPQSLNAMRRLQRVLERHPLTHDTWRKESGSIFRVGRARVMFMSGAREANIVGATASTLLEVDEAQDVTIAKFDKDVAPMAASTNATRVFWGTAWTTQTLLSRELRAARSSSLARAFVLTADDVAREVPAYAKFVAQQVERLGREHPSIRTQYYSEEIDGAGGMFPAWRIAKMMAAGERRTDSAAPVYALLLDIAGEDEGAVGLNGFVQGMLFNPRRDATALTVVQVLPNPGRGKPSYRVVERRMWVGVKHTELYQAIYALAQQLKARHVVVDATGVGAGLASFLDLSLPGRVIPFLFNSASKSKLGWDFLTIVDEGRWQEQAPADRLGALFLQQLAFCQSEVLPGPNRSMRWGVPDGTRDPASGDTVHDDLIISAALSAVLDGLDWGVSLSTRATGIVRAADPLDEMRGF